MEYIELGNVIASFLDPEALFSGNKEAKQGDGEEAKIADQDKKEEGDQIMQQ